MAVRRGAAWSSWRKPEKRRGACGRGPFPAHEFHYAALEDLAPEAHFAYRVRRGTGVDGRRDGVVIGSLMASFSHLRNTLAHPWVERFVEFARRARVAASSAPAAAGFDAPAAGAQARTLNQAGRL